MKTSEMIAMLERNPKLKYRSGIHEVSVDGSGFLKVKYMPEPNLGSGSPSGNFRIVDSDVIKADNWQLVRQPVTWQEAIEARINGKTITCEKCGGCDGDKNCRVKEEQIFLNTKFGIPCWNQIKTGIWYIED